MLNVLLNLPPPHWSRIVCDHLVTSFVSFVKISRFWIPNFSLYSTVILWGLVKYDFVCQPSWKRCHLWEIYLLVVTLWCHSCFFCIWFQLTTVFDASTPIAHQWNMPVNNGRKSHKRYAANNSIWSNHLDTITRSITGFCRRNHVLNQPLGPMLIACRVPMSKIRN